MHLSRGGVGGDSSVGVWILPIVAVEAGRGAPKAPPCLRPCDCGGILSGLGLSQRYYPLGGRVSGFIFSTRLCRSIALKKKKKKK